MKEGMVLITGGLGFLGSSLAESLVEQGYPVMLVSRSKDKLGNIAAFADKVTLELGNVTDFQWIRDIILKHKPRVIFHLAGQLTSYESFEQPLYDVDVNSKATLAMLEAVRELKQPCRFILGSTFWVIGRPTSLPVDEETPCNPLNIYAADRLASEHYCRIYHQVYDLDTVVMRLTNTYGPKEQFSNPRKAALNYLLYLGYKGMPFTIYGTGDFFRDYLYASDAVSAAKVIMDKGEAGESYFVGTGERTWFYDIGRWIEELTPGKQVNVDPPDFHKRIDLGNFVVDNSKLRRLGWTWQISVKEGIERVLDHYTHIGA